MSVPILRAHARESCFQEDRVVVCSAARGLGSVRLHVLCTALAVIPRGRFSSQICARRNVEPD